MYKNDLGLRKIFQKYFIRDSVTNLQPNDNRKQSGIAMFFTEAQVSRIKSKNLMDRRLQTKSHLKLRYHLGSPELSPYQLDNLEYKFFLYK